MASPFQKEVVSAAEIRSEKYRCPESRISSLDAFIDAGFRVFIHKRPYLSTKWTENAAIPW